MKKIHIILIVLLVIVIIAVLAIYIYKNIDRKEYLDEAPGDEDEIKITDDVAKNYWASEYIDYLTKRDIMTNDANNKFNPNEKVNLRDFFISLLKACGVRYDYSKITGEVIVSILTNSKIIQETDNINFDSYVTKQQLAKYTAIADIQIKNSNQKLDSINITDINEYDDVTKSLIIHSVSKKFVECTNSKLNPNVNVSREYLAKALYMLMNG